jgi:hypothetical protein
MEGRRVSFVVRYNLLSEAETLSPPSRLPRNDTPASESSSE